MTADKQARAATDTAAVATLTSAIYALLTPIQGVIRYHGARSHRPFARGLDRLRAEVASRTLSPDARVAC